ncbi:MAG: DUF6443 domain-containing protein [Ekhidna sp.]
MKSLITFLTLSCFTLLAFGQSVTISGPTTSSYGQQKSYTVSASGINLNQADTWWYASSGNSVSNMSTTSADVTWNQSGSQSVSYEATTWNNFYTDTHNVTVSAPPTATPGAPTLQTNGTCIGQATLQRNGTPPAGVTWYWQGKNSSGTSTSLGSGQYYYPNSSTGGSGYYYIRARNNSSGTWSSGSGQSPNVTVSSTPGAPQTVSGSNSCSSNSIVLSAVNEDDVTHKWYTGSTGTATVSHQVITTGSQTETRVTVTSQSVSYWVSATKNGCESGRVQVTATHYSNAVPTVAVDADEAKCSGSTFTNTITGGTGSTFQWYTHSSGGSLLHTGGTYSAAVNYSETSSGTKTYYVGGTLRNSRGCTFPITTRYPVTVTVQPMTGAASISSGVTTRCQGGGTTDYNASAAHANSYNWSISPSSAGSINSSGLVSWNSGFSGTATVSVTAVGTCNNTTANKTVTVDAATVAGSVSSGSNRCGSGSQSFTLAGHSGTIQRWQSRYKNGSGSWTGWSTITETDNVLSVSPTLSQWNSGVRTYEVRAVVKSGSCSTLYPTKTVTVDPVTVAGSVSSASTRCGSGSQSFTLSGHTGTIQRWQSRYKNGSGSWTGWSTITETDNVLSVSPTLSQWNSGVRTYEVRAVVKSGSGCSTLYPTKTVTVDPTTVAGSISSASIRCGSGSQSFTLSGHTGTIQRWQSRYQNGSGSWTSWSTITETDNVLSVSPTLSQWNDGVRTYEVRAVVKSGSGCSTLYPTKTVTVDPVTVAGSISGASTNCGSGSHTFTLANHTGTIQRWQSRYQNGSGSWTSWSTITETDNVLSVSPTLSQWNDGVRTYEVRAVVMSGSGCSTLYPTKTFTVNRLPTLASGGNQSRCGNGTVTLTASPGGSGNTIQWFSASTGGTLLHTGTSYTTPSLSTSTIYYAASYNNSTGCIDTDRTAITAVVNDIPTLASGSNESRCGNGTVTLTASPGGSGNTIQWYSASSGGTLLHTGTSYTTPSLSSNTTYYAASYNTTSGCLDTDRAAIAAQIVAESVGGTVSGGVEKFGVATGSLSLTGHTGSIVKWQYNTTGSWVDVANTTTQLNYTNVQTTTQYRAVVDNGICTETESTIATVTILNVPTLDLGITQSIRPGRGTTLTASPGHASYQWFRNNVQIANESSNQLEVNMTGTYKVTVTSSGNATYTTGDAVITNQLEMNENTIISYTYRTPVTNADDRFLFDVSEQTINVQVYDGLGRPIQSVSLQSSSLEDDIVTPVEYDPFGRKVKEYLPYVSADVDKIFRSSALVDQPGFYQTNKGTNKAYAETRYEPSPLNRPQEQGAPGESWQIGGANTVSYDYETNGVGEVIDWDESDFSNLAGTFFPKEQLSKNIVTDEDGNQTITYTNKQGQTILKKSQVDATTWTNIYYIYDDFNNLRVVLSPEAVRQMNNEIADINNNGAYTWLTENYTITQADADDKFAYLSGVVVTVPSGVTLGTNFELRLVDAVVAPQTLQDFAFLYDYDGRNRMISKKVPGADSVFMVYDKWDRLVLTQDGVQRGTNTWLFTKYDVLNRPVMTGLATIAGTTAAVRDSVQASNERAEAFSAAGTNEYTDLTYPPNDSIDNYLTVTYYDHYDWDTTGLAYTNPAGLTLAGGVKGQVTGTLTKTGAGGWIKSVSYYDDKYRPIQTQSTNHLGGIDVVTNHYDFIGQVMKSISLHDNDDTTFTTTRTFNYDHVGRLLNTWHRLNNDDSVKIVENHYNELGELVRKDLHGGTGGTFAQSLDYAYNIRGWLTSINDPVLTGTDLFGMKLHYDVNPLDNTKQYFNGNISAMEWSNYDTEDVGINERAYTYSYDKLNRLATASHFQNNVSTDNYGVQGLTYDLNGNIESLVRKGAAGTEMDNLTYDYIGNQLREVSDAAADTTGFYDGFTANVDTADYAYDANGNMVKDRNKGIDTIYYNNLNLPTMVVFDSMRFIAYNYDAAGIKLQQQVYDSGVLVKTTDYVGEYIYENRNLELIQHDEGRITAKDDVISISCIDCQSVKSALDSYVTANGSSALLNKSQRTTHLNTALSMSLIESEWDNLLDECDLISTYLDFNGSGYVDFGDQTQYHVGTGDFTVEAWVKFDSNVSTGDYTILANQDNKNGQWSGINFTIHAGKIKLFVADGTGYTGVVATRPSDNTWHHLVAQRIGNNAQDFRIFIDGAEVATTVETSGFTSGNIESGGVENMKIGSRIGSASYVSYFDGEIGEVRMYSRLLTLSEIYSSFNGGCGSNPINSSNLVLWADLIEGAGTTVVDKSVHAQTGTIMGTNVTWEASVKEECSSTEMVNCDQNYDYQYHLKDHLGNVRLTFSTTPDIYERTATMEFSEEQDAFDPWIQSPRNGLSTVGNASANVMRLDTDAQGDSTLIEGITGLSSMYAVQKGDKFDLEVKAYYEQGPASDGFFAANLLFNMLVSGSTGSSTANENSVTNNSNLDAAAVGGIQASKDSTVDTTVPRAYLNWLIFDKDTVLLNAGFKQISSTANYNWETLATSESINIEEDGFFYTYVSNETNALSIVDFDDFKVTLTKTNVVSTQDYYPFGLTFNESVRVASTVNNFTYNGFEEQVEWGVFDYQARYYDPAIGRFINVDPMADLMRRHSTYNYAFDNPIRYIDPDGMVPEPVVGGYGEELSGTASFDHYDFSNRNEDEGGKSETTNGAAKLQQKAEKSKSKFNYLFGSGEMEDALNATDVVAGGLSLLGIAKATQLGGIAAKMPSVFLGSATGAHIFVEDPRLISGFKNAGLKLKSNNFLTRSMSYSNLASVAKWVGVGAAVGGTMYDIYQTGSYYRNGGSDGGHRGGITGLNTTFTAIGLFGGPIGWITSASYFIMSRIAMPDAASMARLEVKRIMDTVEYGTSNPRRRPVKLKNPKFEP